jgi:hypothetical protein
MTLADDLKREAEQLHRRFVYHTRPRGRMTFDQALELSRAMSDDDLKAQANAVTKLVAEISPLLSGHSPDVQSGALADLTAMWLAGHQDLVNPENDALKELREALFANWCETVRALIAPNSAMIRARHGLKRR